MVQKKKTQMNSLANPVHSKKSWGLTPYRSAISSSDFIILNYKKLLLIEKKN